METEANDFPEELTVKKLEEPSTEIVLAPQQKEALDKFAEWYTGRHYKTQQVFYLAGYAGTGKSTIARQVYNILRQYLRRRPRIEVAAFTGKAALVMKTKGWPTARTLHNLIYKLDDHEDEDGNPVFILNKESDLYEADVLLIDESSMVGQDLGKDVCSFGCPILVLGDPGQLPPIDGAGYFTSRQPDYLLTEIHRQALDSPIIRWATAVRTGRGLGGRNLREGNCEIIRRGYTPKGCPPPIHLYSGYGISNDQVICGLNATRHTFNSTIRKLNMPGVPEGQPVVGDKLICLKNNHEKGLLNGGMWEVISTPELGNRRWGMEVKSLDLQGFKCDIEVPMEFFQGKGGDLRKEDLFEADQFDFGYAITCHKSQGSQWDKVFIYNENYVFRENSARWLYTAITRAAKSVVIAL